MTQLFSFFISYKRVFYRDRVMENIVLAKSNRLPLDQANHRIANVNLFLHALGLDASQVSVPM
jgi:DNA topoisomerase 2-associated protein PAT1